MDISSPNLVNFDPGVQRCHAATCISPSLMYLFTIKPKVIEGGLGTLLFLLYMNDNVIYRIVSA